MPSYRPNISKAEAEEYRGRLSKMKAMGIPIGPDEEPSSKPDRFTLEAIHHDFARIFELPMGEVAVVVPAKLKVLISGVLFTDAEMTTPWDDWPLDLSGPGDNPYFQDLVAGQDYAYSPPAILNRFLAHEVPLRPRQHEGVIIAHGYDAVPPTCFDETRVVVQLLLKDERSSEFRFDFPVRMDRSIMRKYEQRQQKRREAMALSKSGGLYEREEGRPGNQAGVSPESSDAALGARPSQTEEQ